MSTPHIVFDLPALPVATAVLVVTYVAIAIERLNRAIVAGVGALAMIVLGVLTQDQAIAGVDFNTIMLLAGMMLVVSVARRSGMFQAVALWAVRATGGRPASVLLALSLATAGISALLDNVTTVLLIVPITLAVTSELAVPAYPFLVSEILAANVGGTATLIGDPPNIIIGSAAGLSFNDFVVTLLPVVVIILFINSLLLHLMWRRRLQTDAGHAARVQSLRPASAITDRRLLIESTVTIGLIVAAFVVSRPLGLEAGTIAMSGAALLVLLDNWHRSPDEQADRIHRTFGEVEWITLFFFIGLFIIVAGVVQAGLEAHLAHAVLSLTGGNYGRMVMVVLWSAALLSSVLDNIPFVATMVPVIVGLQGTLGTRPDALWWALSLGACLGGNGTLVGASANLTVAGLGERGGTPVRFRQFSALAFPLMVMNIGIASIYLYLRFLR